MHLTPVTDLSLPELQIYHQLRDKSFDAQGSFIADSPKVVNELLRSDVKVFSILATQEYYDTYASLLQNKDIPHCFVASKELLQKIVGHTLHHNCMMHGQRPPQSPIEQLGDTVIMLDAITSSENTGAIARSATALGIDSYLLSSQAPHPYGRRALRVSMGYIHRLKYHLYDNIIETLQYLKSVGYTLYAAEITPDAIALSECQVSHKWVLIMGHEQHGISDEILSLCDTVVYIEMDADVKSFNVSVAASIIMYHFQHK